MRDRLNPSRLIPYFCLRHPAALASGLWRPHAVPGRALRLFLIQNRRAAPAHCHSRLHLFTARWMIGRARRDASPYALCAQRNRRPNRWCILHLRYVMNVCLGLNFAQRLAAPLPASRIFRGKHSPAARRRAILDSRLAPRANVQAQSVPSRSHPPLRCLSPRLDASPA